MDFIFRELTTMVKLYDRNGAVRLDKLAIQRKKTTSFGLMLAAGNACLEFISEVWPEINNFTIFCGPGKNGGDGYVLAKLLMDKGYTLQVFALDLTNKLTGDAKKAYDYFIKAGGTVDYWDKNKKVTGNLIVDAIFGIGLDRDLTGNYLNAVKAINEQNNPVLSVDIPSGLNVNTGMAMGEAIIADATVTFICHKIGLATGNAHNYCGDLQIKSLGVELEVYRGVDEVASMLDFSEVIDYKPYRLPMVSKNMVGKVAIVGGDFNMLGATMLAGKAALRLGAGKVTVFTRPEHIMNVPIYQPELMTYAIEDFEEFIERLKEASLIIIGPGLGRDVWGQTCLISALSVRKRMVIDADALYWLGAIEPELTPKDVVLTPHAGEAAYLLKTNVDNIYKDRVATIDKIASVYNATVILKGPGSLVGNSTSKLGVCPYGNPGMASAGMGDALSGIVGSLMAQGLIGYEAASLGVVLHSLAADMLYQRYGNGILASDIIDMACKILATEEQAVDA